MERTMRYVRYATIILALLMLFGLGGWYLYIQRQTVAVSELSDARGFSAPTPSYAGESGSTLRNILGGWGITRGPNAGDSASAQGGGSGGAGTNADGTGGSDTGGGGFISGVFGMLTGSDSTQTAERVVRPPRLWRVHPTPVAGATFAATSTIRYMERATGHLFEADINTGKIVRKTSTLIPKVLDASLSQNAVVAQALTDSGESVVLKGSVVYATSTESQGSIRYESLGEGTLTGVQSNNNQILYTLVSQGAGSTLIRSRFDGTSPVKLFESHLKGWLVHYLPDGRVFVAQRPSSGAPGYAYEVLQNGALIPVARNIPGLTIRPRASSTALLIGSDDGSLRMFARTANDSSTVELPIRTVADKCAWVLPQGATSTLSFVAFCGVPKTSTSKKFIDEWYAGKTHTSDDIWRIDVGAGTAERVFSPESEANYPVDVEKMRVGRNGEYILFTNALDKTLMLFRMNP